MVTPISPAEIRIGVLETSPQVSLEVYQSLLKWQELHITDCKISNEEIHFLITTKIAYWIACFKNSSASGAVKHTPLELHDGQVGIRCLDTWKSIHEVMNLVEWDSTLQKIVSRDNPDQGWSYNGIQGLQPCDRFHYEQLQPICNLSSHERSLLLDHARLFWGGKGECQSHSAVLQVITTKRAPSSIFIGENSAGAMAFEHVTFRLVDAVGQVYSFGVELEGQNLSELDGAFNFFKTTTAYLSSPDYEESRRFFKKRVTSLSISERQLQGIVHYVEELNKKGLSFNYCKQNCSTMAREVLHQAGVENAHESSSLLEWLFLYIRESSHAGRRLTDLLLCIQRVVSTIFFYLPSCIGDLAQCSLNLLLKTFYVLPCGGISSAQVRPLEACPPNTVHLTSFSRLVSSVKDLFDGRVDAHFKLIEWQTRQPTTCLYRNTEGPKLYGLQLRRQI